MQAYDLNKETVHVLHPTGDAFSWLEQLKRTGPCKRLYLVADIRSQGIGILPAFVKQLVADSELNHVR
jgi:hypothetical protein